MSSQFQEIRKFAKQIKANHPYLKAVYIAVMPNDTGFDLEIEVSSDTIDGLFETGWPNTVKGLASAHRDADTLDRELGKLGIKVYATRDEWEEFLHGPKSSYMDQNECLKALHNSVLNGDDSSIREYAKALEKWLEQGGAMPEVTRDQLVMFLQSVDMLATSFPRSTERKQREA